MVKTIRVASMPHLTGRGANSRKMRGASSGGHRRRMLPSGTITLTWWQSLR